jgi:hypothetical protein
MSLYLLIIAVFVGLVSITASVLPAGKAIWLTNRATLVALFLMLAILVVDRTLPQDEGCAAPHSALSYLQLALALLAEAVTAVALGASIRAAARWKSAVLLTLAQLVMTGVILVLLFWPWFCGNS